MNIFQALYCRVCFVKPYSLDGFVNAKIQIGYNLIVIDIDHKHKIVELIQTCTELGVEPFKSFTLERRTSEKTGAEYIAVVLKMFNDDEYFYFLPRATNTIVELLIAKAAQDETATPAKKG